MIDRTQLVEALGRLDPRDREVLDYSLRRHVPDSDLAAVFDCGPSDVARMRAAAVERLADDLGVQRGADLGQVLTALLDTETWAQLPETGAPAVPDEATAPAKPAATSDPAAPAKPSPTPPPVAPAASGADRGNKPVLGMLGPTPAEGVLAPPSDSGRSRWSLAAAALIGVLVAVGIGSVVLLGNDDAGSSAPGDENSATRPFERQDEQVGEPFPSDPSSAYRYPIAILDEEVDLHDAPAGRTIARLAPETEWNSPRVLSVVQREGDWLAVLAPELENGEVGWIQEADVDRLDTVGWAMKADISKRTLVVERDGKPIRRMEIAVGRKDHPTPLGRFAVTDKLNVADPNSPYGCCVVALTGHQTRLPEGWPGGDRLAVHATQDLSGLGEAVSLGCMRVDPKDAEWLLKVLPLGTPVFIEQ